MPQARHRLLEKARQILPEDVAEDDLDVFAAREGLGQDGHEALVELHAHDPARPRRELPGQAADARPDLEDAGALVQIRGGGDVLRHPGGGQEVLPQGFVRNMN